MTVALIRIPAWNKRVITYHADQNTALFQFASERVNGEHECRHAVCYAVKEHDPHGYGKKLWEIGMRKNVSV